MDPIFYWNEVVNEADRTTHTTGAPAEAGSRGPCGSSRAYAIVHLAMHDAYFGINQKYDLYLDGLPTPQPGASADAAVAAAAHATLIALYPAQKAFFDARLAAAGLPGGQPESDGRVFGLAVAEAILALRRNDPGLGSTGYVPSPARMRHRQDPDNPDQGFYAPFYGARSRNFAVTTRHHLDEPPQLGSAEYGRAFRQVRSKGIAPQLIGTLPADLLPSRTPTETLIGLFWAYDGARGLGTPPRLYNQIIRRIADGQGNDVAANARLFALVNAAMADAGILAWDDKYIYDVWRPVVGIREHDPSTGPGAVGGSVLDADADPGWLPLGSPSTNNVGRKNFTPPFPAYPSGHATFGAAAFQTVRRFYGQDGYCSDDLVEDLKFVSEELNGISVDNTGTVRPRHTRRFPGGVWQMIEENSRSRIFQGVHWVFDGFAVNEKDEIDLTQNIGGVRLGIDIANNIANNGLKAAAAAGPRLEKERMTPERVYVLSNASEENSVIVFTRGEDGMLVPLGELDPLVGFPPNFGPAFAYNPAGFFGTGGRGSGGPLLTQGPLALDAEGRYLFVVNPGSDEISSLAVTPTGLRLLSTVPSGGVEPRSVTVHDNLVYVVNGFGTGKICGFRVDVHGVLFPLPGSERDLPSPDSAPVQISFTEDGAQLVVSELFADRITVFSVGSDGLPTDIRINKSAGESPFGFAFNRNGILIVSESFGFRADESAVSSYRLDDKGVLRVISKSVPTTEAAACWIANTPDGRYTYTTNTVSGSVSGYRVDREGRLTLLTKDGRTAVTGALSGPLDMVISGDGKFLYVLNQITQSIASFRIEDDGRLTPAPDTGGLPPGAVGMAIG